MGELKVGDIVDIEGTIELVSRTKDFGNNKRVNIKLKDSQVEWISFVSTRDRVEKFKKEYTSGNRIHAKCKVHEGRDSWGNPRKELWIQEVSKVKRVGAVKKENILEVDQYFIEQLKRAEKIAKRAGMLTKNGEKYAGIVSSIFAKISRHEFYIEEEM